MHGLPSISWMLHCNRYNSRPACSIQCSVCACGSTRRTATRSIVSIKLQLVELLNSQLRIPAKLASRLIIFVCIFISKNLSNIIIRKYDFIYRPLNLLSQYSWCCATCMESKGINLEFAHACRLSQIQLGLLNNY